MLQDLSTQVKEFLYLILGQADFEIPTNKI